MDVCDKIILKRGKSGLLTIKEYRDCPSCGIVPTSLNDPMLFTCSRRSCHNNGHDLFNYDFLRHHIFRTAPVVNFLVDVKIWSNSPLRFVVSCPKLVFCAFHVDSHSVLKLCSTEELLNLESQQTAVETSILRFMRDFGRKVLITDIYVIDLYIVNITEEDLFLRQCYYKFMETFNSYYFIYVCSTISVPPCNAHFFLDTFNIFFVV